MVGRISRDAGVADRVDTIKGGNLAALLKSASGCILINSTVGLQAARLGVPVKVLGVAIYDVEGLTDQKTLDRFFADPERPCPRKTRAFVKALAGATQVKGTFLSKAGRRVAIKTAVDRLLSGQVNSHGAYVEPPPRLKRARQVGVPLPDER